MMSILCCPYCKSSLDLSTEKQEKEKIITGSLQCKHCNKTYPIVDSIPNFIDE